LTPDVGQTSVLPPGIPAGARYMLETPILSVYQRGDSRVLLRIPAGEEVRVVGEQPGTPFLAVQWQSELLQLFALDLRERAQPLGLLGNLILLAYKHFATSA
jgi:hypothetical protein